MFRNLKEMLMVITKMKMMMIKRLLFLILFLSASVKAFSQKSDFGVWYNISIKHELTKKLNIELSPVLRTYKNASKIEEVFLEGELSYDLTKFISLAGSYRIINNIEDDDNYHLRHKWYAGIKGSFDFWRIDFSGRARFERRYKTYFEDEDDKIPSSHLRFKASAVLKTPSFPLNPYISGELFFPVNKEPEDLIDKKRFAAGVEYKISKKHAIDLEYIYQSDYYPKLRYEHIISVKWEFKF